jgi:hypothetical protein
MLSWHHGARAGRGQRVGCLGEGLSGAMAGSSRSALQHGLLKLLLVQPACVYMTSTEAQAVCARWDS